VPSRDLAIEANGRRLPCPGVVSTRRGATTDPCGSRAPRVTRARIVFGRRSEEPSVRTDRYERRPCSRLVWGTTTFPFGRSRVLVRTSAERSFGNRTGIFGVWLAAAGTAAIDCFRERIEARHTRLREHLHPRHTGDRAETAIHPGGRPSNIGSSGSNHAPRKGSTDVRPRLIDVHVV
jgi:hypothetical protein